MNPMGLMLNKSDTYTNSFLELFNYLLMIYWNTSKVELELDTKFNYIALICPMFIRVIAIQIMNSEIKDYVSELLFKIVQNLRFIETFF